MNVEEIAALIKDVPDFPKPGIVYKDITPVLANAVAFEATVGHLAARARDWAPAGILAIESRGFIFGAALAHRLRLPLQLVRKRGKLPRASVSVRYELEYGSDHLEIHADAIVPGHRYLIVDDLIATGGTVAATIDLARRQGGIVAGCVFVVELAFLGGRGKLDGVPVESVVSFRG